MGLFWMQHEVVLPHPVSDHGKRLISILPIAAHRHKESRPTHLSLGRSQNAA
jgi:hypothetical protein